MGAEAEKGALPTKGGESVRIEAHNDIRNNLPTAESRIAFSDGHKTAMEGKPIPEKLQKSEKAEDRSFRNGHEAGMRARRLKEATT